jgi:hypothetical protein
MNTAAKLLVGLVFAILGAMIWVPLFGLWTRVGPQVELDPRVFSFLLLSGLLAGFLSGLLFLADQELRGLSKTKRFVECLFSSSKKAEEMLTAQAILCEAASQEIIEFQRDGLGIRSTVVDFENLYAKLKRTFQAQQELFYLMYDIEAERRMSDEHALPLEARSFKNWVPALVEARKREEEKRRLSGDDCCPV